MFRGLQPPDPPLSDGVVALRPPGGAEDAATLTLFAADEEIRRWIYGGTPGGDAPQPEEVFARQLERWQSGSDAFFSIDAVGHPQRVGLARVLFGLYVPYGFAEIGYFLLADGRGHGYATRSVRLLADWVLRDLGVTRLQARTHPENPASERVLERVGFKREGLARAGYLFPVSGEYADAQMWSLLPSDLA